MTRYSKIEVAKRQVETAIDLFFCDSDPVSIHTLTCASHEILEGLGKNVGVHSVLNEGMAGMTKKDTKSIRDKINQPKNFFKHATKDPLENVDFNKKVTPYFLYDSCRLYNAIVGKYTTKMVIYSIWFGLKHPDLFPKLNEALPISTMKIEGIIDDHPQFYKLALTASAGFNTSKFFEQ